MKKLSIIILMSMMASPVIASQGDMSVEITSYIAAGLRTRSAELCGKINNMNQSWVVVKANIDANTKSPGSYTTLVGSEAKFCLAVVTNGGSAEVSLAALTGESIGPVLKGVELEGVRR